MDAGPDEIDEKAEPNKLMVFFERSAAKTKSMFLATATPVQLHRLKPGICYISFPRETIASSAAGRRPARGLDLASVLQSPSGIRAFQPTMSTLAGNTFATPCRHGMKGRRSIAFVAV